MYITLPEVTSYIDHLYRPFHKELGELRCAAEKEHIPIILKDTETLLLNCIRLQKPQRILEIGTAVGYSAICFASVSPEISVTTLEKNPQMVQLAEENINRFGLKDRIEIIAGDASERLKELSLQFEQKKNNEFPDIEKTATGVQGFDLVFIDAAKAQYRVFWDEAVKMLAPQAVIISDNVLFKAMTVADEFGDKKKNGTIMRRMREYLSYITTLADVSTSVLPVGDGVAISCFLT